MTELQIGDVVVEGPHQPTLGAGGNVWIIERFGVNGKVYLVGPSLTRDGNHRHLMAHRANAQDLRLLQADDSVVRNGCAQKYED